MGKNYVVYHLHSDLSNSSTPDSTTKFEEYIDLALKNNMKALGFSEHGGVYEWVRKKQAMDKVGLKYIHGMEAYLTTTLDEKINEAYHIGLYARNWEGVKEINRLSSNSYRKDDNHFYYKPRISLDELFNTSDNIIVTTACLGSIFWQRRNDEELMSKILDWVAENNHRVFFEIQYHNHPEQIEYNQMLWEWSKKYNVPLIAGTDTHSSTKYKAECRQILQKAKNISYGDEDTFDLTFKSYDELVEMFRKQNSLPEEVWMEAIENTNVFADMIEEFELDYSFKYPNLYEDEEKTFMNLVRKKYNEKIKKGIIDKNNPQYKKNIQEEFKAFKKLGMLSFMTFMSELATWCWENNIPIGFNRGSVGGSTIAYILDITDLDPVKWNTVFSRFVNEDRISLGDIDMDFSPDDRDKVYEYIQNRFPKNHTAYIITFNTVADKGAIDEIGRALKVPLNKVAKIKEEFEIDPDATKKKYPDIFYYFDGIRGTIISKGMHPAGMVASPISLDDNLGILYENELPIVQCGMKSVDSLNYVKYDILGLKNIGLIKKTMEYVGKPYPKSHEINWNDEKVWDDMITSPVGIFQFEGNYAFSMLKKFKPRQINDMSLVNAALRPSGESYRDKLMNREFHKNPSKEIDELLKDNLGYLVFQEDTIKFLTDICGFSGAEADSVRRAIGKKDEKALREALPKILDGYCNNSNKPREVAEQEAKEFLRIIQDSADYQFGFNHSTGYSMIGYTCAMLRYYYPLEFITAFLNTAANEDDIKNGTELARQKGIEIKPIKFGKSLGEYTPNKKDNSIYKGLASVKYLNHKIADELMELSKNKYDTFTELLIDIHEKTSVNSRQLDILIRLNFFEEFGSIERLLAIYDNFVNGDHKYKKTYVDKTKQKRIAELIKWEKETDDIIEFSISDKIKFQKEVLGYAELTLDVPKSHCIVLEVDTKYTPLVTLYQLQTGKEIRAKIKKNTFYTSRGELCKEGDYVEILKTFKDYKWRKTENGFEQDKTQKELFIASLRHVK